MIHFNANWQINLDNASGQEMVALVPEPVMPALLAVGAVELVRKKTEGNKV